jgi:hypothetical protein
MNRHLLPSPPLHTCINTSNQWIKISLLPHNYYCNLVLNNYHCDRIVSYPTMNSWNVRRGALEICCSVPTYSILWGALNCHQMLLGRWPAYLIVGGGDRLIRHKFKWLKCVCLVTLCHAINQIKLGHLDAVIWAFEVSMTYSVRSVCKLVKDEETREMRSSCIKLWFRCVWWNTF